jgi:probable HAF family extracellular repeat protein
MSQLCWRISILAAFAFSAVGLALGDVSFQGIGNYYGFNSGANGVSADGSFVAGFAAPSSNESHAILWTPSGGTTILGDLPGGVVSAWANNVSADGNVVVGQAFPSSNYEAFRWTPSTGMVGLGFLPGRANTSAQGVSADGSIIVGQAASPGNEGFRWTETGGMQGLGSLYAGGRSYAFDISPDGERIVGGTSISATQLDAAYWTESGGWTSIGRLSGGLLSLEAFASDASTDGSVIVGNSPTALVQYSYESFRWTESGGIQGLGILQPDHNLSTATGVSGDGEIVVGVSGPYSGVNRRPYIWDETHGMRDLGVVLETDYGLDLTGWTLVEVLDISEDGNTFVGYGTNPLGITEGWVATIPEPSTLGLLLIGALSIALRRRV